jgi:AcrR family transcriptional regulator
MTTRRPARSTVRKPARIAKDSEKIRTRLETDARREQLLALAEQVFADRAYDEVSIDDIARAAKVSKGLLYHYFPTKRDLYVATVRRAAGELLGKTILVDRDHEPPIERIRAGVGAYLAHVGEHAAQFTALMRGGIGSDPEVAAVIEETRQRYVDKMLADAEHAPLPVRPHESPLLRVTLRGWLGFVEAASIDWAARKDVPAAELRDLLVDLFLGAIQRAVGGVR